MTSRIMIKNQYICYKKISMISFSISFLPDIMPHHQERFLTIVMITIIMITRILIMMLVVLIILMLVLIVLVLVLVLVITTIVTTDHICCITATAVSPTNS